MTDQEAQEVAIIVLEKLREAFQARYKGREGTFIRPKHVIDMLGLMILKLPQPEPVQESILIVPKEPTPTE